MSTGLGMALPAAWSWLPLKFAAAQLGRGTAPNYVDDGLTRVIGQASNQLSGLDWQRTRLHGHEGSPRLLKGYLCPDDVLINSTGNGTLGRVGYFEGGPDGRPCIADGHITVVRARREVIEPRYLYYWLGSSLFYDYIYASLVVGATNQIELYLERLAAAPVALPPLGEQRRIADLLDAETARIDRIAQLRRSYRALSESRSSQIVDGVVAGVRESLAEIGSGADGGDWDAAKVSHLFSITPGFAFDSANFRQEGGTRLLRGINVGIGRVGWDAETVSWDARARPVESRFHLRVDDLVVGMDRTWIGGGTRVALIRERDTPALLLQRVACLRPRGAASTRYLRWVLGSSHFRLALEGETTGVSVPHISGDQIGSFRFALPPSRDQEILAGLLDEQDELQRRRSELVDRQLARLMEYRQALVMAAVTGQIDTSTARGAVPMSAAAA